MARGLLLRQFVQALLHFGINKNTKLKGKYFFVSNLLVIPLLSETAILVKN